MSHVVFEADMFWLCELTIWLWYVSIQLYIGVIGEMCTNSVGHCL